MQKLLVSTILATSLLAGGALAQTQTQQQQQQQPGAQNPPAASGAATSANRTGGAMQQTPIAMNKLSANKLIGADVRTYVATDSRATPRGAPGAAGTAGTGTTATTGATGGSGAPASTASPGATTGTGRTGTVAGASTTVDQNISYDTEYLGEVYDIILGQNGVEQLVIETGGILGFGERYRTVKFDQAQLVRQGDDVVVLLRMSQAQLRAQPAFEYGDGWWD